MYLYNSPSGTSGTVNGEMNNYYHTIIDRMSSEEEANLDKLKNAKKSKVQKIREFVDLSNSLTDDEE